MQIPVIHYVVRIELHGASGSDYDLLHHLMARGGFSRSISSAKGNFELPTGMYCTVVTQPRSAMMILDAAKGIAAQVGKRFYALVTRADQVAWDNDCCPTIENGRVL